MVVSEHPEDYFPKPQPELVPDASLAKHSFAERTSAAWDIIAEVLLDPTLDKQPALKGKILEAFTGLSQANAEQAQAIQEIEKKILTLQPMLILPKNLILVRHGESEKNLLNHSPEGTFPPELEKTLRELPDNELRLTPKGVKQGDAAGRWLKENFEETVDKAMTSGFRRARETMGHLALALGINADIYKDPIFSEQWFGEFDLLPREEREALMRKIEANPRHEALPQGESLLDKEFAFRLGLAKFRRKYSDQNVLVVCHGIVITAGRCVIEKIPDDGLKQISREGVPNGGIVHYSRQNPETKEWGRGYDWVRLVNPLDLKWRSGVWNGEWRKIERPVYTPEELLAEVEQQPRIFSYDEE